MKEIKRIVIAGQLFIVYKDEDGCYNFEREADGFVYGPYEDYNEGKQEIRDAASWGYAMTSDNYDARY